MLVLQERIELPFIFSKVLLATVYLVSISRMESLLEKPCTRKHWIVDSTHASRIHKAQMNQRIAKKRQSKQQKTKQEEMRDNHNHLEPTSCLTKPMFRSWVQHISSFCKEGISRHLLMAATIRLLYCSQGRARNRVSKGM